MKAFKKRTAEQKLELTTEFMDRHGIPYAVNRNPTPEEIAEIKNSFKSKDELIDKLKSNRKHTV